MKALFLACLVACACALLTQEDVDEINSKQKLWTASLDSKTARMSEEDFKHLLGVVPGPSGLPRKTIRDVSATPDAWDWSNSTYHGLTCPSLFEIRDQSDCGSCWAFGAVESMSDRYCISSKGESPLRISAEVMNSCASTCGSCNGGQPACAFKYWVDKGLPTEECAPYSLPSCDHHIPNSLNPCPDDMYKTPTYPTTCTVTGQTWTINKGSNSYEVANVKNNYEAMATEIYTNGPCETAFTVYEDFEVYTGGIYVHTKPSLPLGGHAVKIVGWGEESGTKYWKVANSWNTNWGEKGFFRIIRGQNECGIEDAIYCGTPLL